MDSGGGITTHTSIESETVPTATKFMDKLKNFLTELDGQIWED